MPETEEATEHEHEPQVEADAPTISKTDGEPLPEAGEKLGRRERRRLRRRLGDFEREREALLLDLGALIHELQLHGRREPRLLLPKAAELAAVDGELRQLARALGDERHAPAEQTCSFCQTSCEPGQLVCLNCGARFEVEERRPPRQPPIALLALIVGLVGSVSVLAYAALDDGGKGNRAPASQGRPAAQREVDLNSDGKRAKKVIPEASPRDDTAPAAAEAGGLTEKDGLYGWPSDLSGYTVVLTSNGDRESATSFASSSKQDGDRLGVLHSDDFSSLQPGFYMVFAGKYDSSAAAQQAATKLQPRFGSAFVQEVRP